MMKSKGVIRKILSILSWIITAVLLLITLLNLYVIIAKNVFHVKMPAVFGYSSAVVVTGSMEGGRKDSISVGDMVIIHREKDYQVGDIVTYDDGLSAPVTHRVIKKDGDSFVTQGDANNTSDPAIDRNQIVGKVVLIIPKIGNLLQKLQSPLGMLILLLIGFLLIEWQTIAEFAVSKITKKQA